MFNWRDLPKFDQMWQWAALSHYVLYTRHLSFAWKLNCVQLNTELLRLCFQKHFFVNGVSIWIIFSVEGLFHFQSLGFFLLEAKNTWLLGGLKHRNISYILWVLLLLRSQSSLVVTAAVLRVGQAGFRILVGIRDFPLLWNFQTASRAHPASYSVGNGVLSRVRDDVDHFTSI